MGKPGSGEAASLTELFLGFKSDPLVGSLSAFPTPLHRFTTTTSFLRPGDQAQQGTATLRRPHSWGPFHTQSIGPNMGEPKAWALEMKALSEPHRVVMRV